MASTDTPPASKQLPDEKKESTIELKEEVSEEEHPWDAYENVWRTTLDSKGRKSLACRRKSTGEITAWADEFYEKQVGPGGPKRNEICKEGFRNVDEVACWFLFEDWKSERMRSFLQITGLPVMVVWLICGHVKMLLKLWWLREERDVEGEVVEEGKEEEK